MSDTQKSLPLETVVIIMVATVVICAVFFTGLMFVMRGGTGDSDIFIGPPIKDGNGIACTQEAMLCPDGSYVGRTGPNCEFETCPQSYGDDAIATACPEDARMCPDGSSVGRVGPDCEFASCSDGRTSDSPKRCDTDADCATDEMCVDPRGGPINPDVTTQHFYQVCWPKNDPLPY